MAFSRLLTLVHLLLVSCAVFAWLPSVAGATPSAAERETARSLMDEGDQLVARGDYKAALSRYESAHAIMHVPTTGLSLARVQAELGMLVEARGTAMEVINLPVARAEPKVFADARRAAGALATELEPRVPSIKTVVAPADVRFTLNIDGVSLPAEARLVAFRTNPGSHAVRIEAPGYVSQTRQVSLVEGQLETLSVELQMAAAEVTPPPTVAVPAPPAPPAPIVAAVGPEPVDPAAPGRTRGIVALSAGGALLLAGTITGVMSIVKTNEQKETCPGGHCAESQSGALSTANTLANVANVCVPLGVVGIGYGLFELLTLPSSTPSAKPQSGVHVAWTGTGAVVRGSL